MAVTHAPCGLSILFSDTGNFFRLDSEPLQETLVCVRVAGLKQLVPAHASLLIHAALSEHGDPLLYVDMVFHMTNALPFFVSSAFS